MSRSDYTYDYDYDHLAQARWRGQVASTIRGKKGQEFLREMIAALDAMPDKRLIAHELHEGPNVCAIGSVGLVRGIDMAALDPEDYDAIASAFGITHQLVREIEFYNDEAACSGETPEERWARMRSWVLKNLRNEPP